VSAGCLALLLVCSAGAAADEKTVAVTIDSANIPAAVDGDFGTIIEGQDAVLQITVTNSGTTPLQVGTVKPLCSCMTQSSDREVAPGGSGTITLRLETVGYAGATTEAALIEWIDRQVALTRAEMKMVVQPILEVSPRKLVRFRAVEGEPATDQVTVRRSDGKPLVIQKVETSASYLTAAAKGTEDGGVEVVVTLGPDAPNGILKGSLSLHTDVPEMPILELKVAGLVAARKALNRDTYATE
jgi:hypothetical protein